MTRIKYNTQNISLVHLKQLELDPQNPRLPSTYALERTQQTMLEYLARETSIEELMNAIGENDFFEGEALIVIPKQADQFIVVEGNRRLVALRLLQEPDLYPKRKGIKEIAENAKYKPDQVPIAIYLNREKVLDYLGYRHITGIKQWDILATARYMHRLFFQLTDKNLDISERYRQVAVAIGTRSDHVRRTLNTLAVFNLIEKNDFFGIKGLDETTISFSLLTMALDYDSISHYVGANLKNVDETDIAKTKNLTRWLFEQQEGGGTILGESQNLSLLADILESEKATQALLKGASLEQAYRLSFGVTDDFIGYLYKAEEYLEESNAIKANVKIDVQMIELATRIFNQARTLKRSMEDDY
jgi:hypothetical protein